MHCELDVCIPFGWIAVILYLVKCREKLNGLSGHCPWIQWTLSMVTEFPAPSKTTCPWIQWTLSMVTEFPAPSKTTA